MSSFDKRLARREFWHETVPYYATVVLGVALVAASTEHPILRELWTLAIN